MRRLPVLLMIALHAVLLGCASKGSSGEVSDPLVKLSNEAPEHDTVRATSFNIRMRGISFSAPPREVGRDVFDGMAAIGAEWVAIVPYAFGPGDDGRLKWNVEGWQWWGETEQGTRAQIRLAKAAGLSVMVKPHLWLEHGDFTGTYEAKHWEAFAASYRDYLLLFARVAEAERVELLCIGTELRRFTEQRPAFWSALIDTLRTTYKGQLTYAANWDEVAHVPFWQKLDLIGVDGYFPLTQRPTSSVDSIAAGWAPHVRLLSDLSARVNKPVLFTEMGYTCTTNCTVEPWKEDNTATSDQEAQAAAYSAFFRTMNAEPWYAGCFVWKWFAHSGKRSERQENDFSPQGKDAMDVLKRAFAE